MLVHFNEEQAVAAVPRLTVTRLVAFIEAEVVMPVQSEQGPLFSQADLARLALLCDLMEDFALEGDALGVVMQLIDQLHDARRRFVLLADAIKDEPLEVRQRLGRRLAAAIE